MSSPSPREVFLRLVHGVCDRKYDTVPELYAERTDVRQPMSPYPTAPVTPRDDLRRHFGAGRRPSRRSSSSSPTGSLIHETHDPEVVVADFEYRGTVTATGEPFVVPCVFVLRVRDGQIIESRDHIHHPSFARAQGRLDQLVSALQPVDVS